MSHNGRPIDADRILAIARELELSHTEVTWFFGIPDNTWYRWRKTNSRSQNGSLLILVNLVERAMMRPHFQVGKFHRFIGLTRDQAAQLTRLPDLKRSDALRQRGLVYMARCAYTDTELLQLTLPEATQHV
ncbi:MAG: hypothetical protein K0U84_14110 [Actinomycetia bacterium]|nr:hypothetical protein [Actinomycetes bacterium]